MHVALFVKDFAVGEKFSKNGLPTKSGAEFHAENHALQLIKRGHRVSIFAKKRHFFTKARETLNGIDLVRLHAPIRWLEIIFRLFSTHRNVNAFYIIGTPKFAVWAILYARIFHVPVTLALTGKAEIFDKNKNWRNKILSTCTNYIATTHEIQNGLIRYGGVEPGRVTVLAHGVDMSKYPPVTDAQKQALRKAHNIPFDAHVLLFCARIVLNKGIDVVMRIWPQLHAQDPKAVLLVVGGGRHELMHELQNMAAHVDGTAVIVGEVDNPREYYQMADVYIFPSHHEGLPTSLIEAMSSGLPAVTSDIGGCDDLIFNDVTGYRVTVDEDGVFLEKVRYLFQHREQRLRMGKHATGIVRKYCDYTQIIDKLADILACEQPCGRDYLQVSDEIKLL
ncbi:MAG: glycosyltransferase family 4 protein [Selenomonadaceae bacterium]|nr:glycosyltransferase family 4 protein [Selenomonadaceae bacterium]MDY3916730.1 glycosyltransferase family 4 protein [Selenomonadaceae bacterium]